MDGFTVVFLGTCACDFSPRLQTDCKDRFDKDVRRSSSILIDGHILVDCGPECCGRIVPVRITGRADGRCIGQMLAPEEV